MAQAVYIVIDSTIPSVTLAITSGGASTFSYVGTGEGVSFAPSPESLDLNGADAQMAFVTPLGERSAQWEFDELALFEIDSVDQLATAADLQSVVTRCLPFFVDAGSGGGTLSGIGMFYVSAFASAGGNGSIGRPFQAISAANTAALAFFTAEGYAATIRVMAGTYNAGDEEIILAGHLECDEGAEWAVTTGTDPVITVDGSIGADFRIQGMNLFTQTAAVSVHVTGGAARFINCRLNTTSGAGLVVQVSGGGAFFENCRFTQNESAENAVMVEAGTASFVSCIILHFNAGTPIDVQGGSLKLYQCRIVGTSTNSIVATAGPQTIETFGTVATDAPHGDITETVGSITVSAAVTAD